jgi:hypothetical protein
MLRTSLALLLGAADMLVLDPWRRYRMRQEERRRARIQAVAEALARGVSVHSVGEVIEARNSGYAEGTVL